MVNKNANHDPARSIGSNRINLTESISMIIYLYIKTHNITGLKYLGKTIAKDPHKYPGSGIYWASHLNKHGKNYTTEILKECHSKEELIEWGIYYSRLWNIVDSDEWANLKEEQGDGGRQSAEVRKRISEAGKGRIPWNKGIHCWNEKERVRIGELNRRRGGQSAETINKRIEKNTGQIRTDEQKQRMSSSQKGRQFSKEHKEKLKIAAQNRKLPPWNKGITMQGDPATAKRYSITTISNGEHFIIISLRKWCLSQNINYQVFHRYTREGKPYKNYKAIELI
jgi:hypothetical protein